MTKMHHVDFTKGHWRHKPIGITSSPRKQEGVGKQYVVDNPIWFKGCTCKKDVIPIISRWEVTRPTEQQIETVARTIRNKNKKVDLDTIVESLTSFVENLHDQD